LSASPTETPSKVRVGNEFQTVRIIGYNAPELNQPFGDKASLYLKTLLEGREVILESEDMIEAVLINK
jgi:endonuclease YncB( thermonuclease family)